MFIASLTYVKPLQEVEKHIEEHIALLDKYSEMKAIISEDSFHRNEIAKYEIIEFYPTKYAADFKAFI